MPSVGGDSPEFINFPPRDYPSSFGMGFLLATAHLCLQDLQPLHTVLAQ